MYSFIKNGNSHSKMSKEFSKEIKGFILNFLLKTGEYIQNINRPKENPSLIVGEHLENSDDSEDEEDT